MICRSFHGLWCRVNFSSDVLTVMEGGEVTGTVSAVSQAVHQLMFAGEQRPPVDSTKKCLRPANQILFLHLDLFLMKVCD